MVGMGFGPFTPSGTQARVYCSRGGASVSSALTNVPSLSSSCHLWQEGWMGGVGATTVEVDG